MSRYSMAMPSERFYANSAQRDFSVLRWISFSEDKNNRSYLKAMEEF
jgi:hypothetical protein